jgi:hypothetical protein
VSGSKSKHFDKIYDHHKSFRLLEITLKTGNYLLQTEFEKIQFKKPNTNRSGKQKSAAYEQIK